MVRWLVAAALVSFCATGCGGGKKAGPTSTSTVSHEQTSTPRAVASATPSVTPSPLATFGPDVPPGSLIFRAGGNANFDVFRVDADGNNLANLTHNPAFNAPGGWSPDGTVIAFTRDSDVYLMDPDGSNPRDLTAGTGGVFVAWSPDSARILFGFFGETFGEWWVMNRDGTGRTKVVPRCGPCYSPQWAKDSHTLLAQMPLDDTQGSTKTGLFVIGLDGAVVRRFPDATNEWNEFRWSPDGKAIAYIAGSMVGQGAVFVMDADGSHSREIWHGDEPHSLGWSPDSSQIAFLARSLLPVAPDSPSPPAASWNLTVLDLVSGDQRVLATNASMSELAWSPDGQHFAYAADADDSIRGHVQIFVIPAGGGRPIDVSNGRWEDSVPNWSPDSRHLLFRSDRTSRDGVYWLDPGTGATGLIEALNPQGLLPSELPAPSAQGSCISQTQLPNTAPVVSCLSPDRKLQATVNGQRLIVTDTGTGTLRASSPDGLQVEPVPPAWSFDGRRVAFLTREGQATTLYRLALDTSETVRLVAADAIGNPTQTVLWSRGGDTIYFTRGSVCHGGCSPGFLYRVSADGTGERQLTELRVATLYGFAP